jgi:mono/diheme cytochrome c family protein
MGGVVRAGAWLGLVALAGCAGGRDGAAPQTGSASIVSDGQFLYTANSDAGSVSRIDRGGLVLSAPVGEEPRRLAVSGDALFVSLTGEGRVLRLDARTLDIEEEAEVGAEPFGIVAAPDGSAVFVALRLADEVLELDPDTLEVRRSWSAAEPWFLAIAPDGSAVYATSARNDAVTRIAPATGDLRVSHLPQVGWEHALEGRRGRMFVEEPASDLPRAGTFAARATGDGCVTVDGDLVVPALFVDHVLPIPIDFGGLLGLDDEENGGAGYSSPGGGVGRINPALVTFHDADGGLEPETPWGIEVLDEEMRTRKGYLSSVTCDADGRYLAATAESQDLVLVVDSEPFDGQGDYPVRKALEGLVTLPSAGMAERPVTAAHGGDGPRGAAFVGGDLWVHAAFADEIARVPWEDAVDVNRAAANDRREKVAFDPFLRRVDRIELPDSPLSSVGREGRDLFFAADDPAMTSVNGGVSCSTCHVEGRNDGFTWSFVDGVRQTPSLAGGIGDTGPFTWDGAVPSVGEEAHRTATIRMGGEGPDERQRATIEAFVGSLPRPAVDPKLDPADVAAGAALFVEANCDACHSGPAYTDGLTHTVAGRVSDTPSLRGIAATAPYYHDGRSATLTDALGQALALGMGELDDLDATEFAQLEAFLRSL